MTYRTIQVKYLKVTHTVILCVVGGAKLCQFFCHTVCWNQVGLALPRDAEPLVLHREISICKVWMLLLVRRPLPHDQ